MKIIIDARFLGTPTGIGRYVEELVRGLENLVEAKHRPKFKAEIGDSLEFVVLVSKVGWDVLESMNFDTESPPQAQHVTRCHRFRKKLVDAPWYTLAEQFALWRALRQEKPDLVHFPHWNICYFWRGPFVVMIHDLILLEYPTRRASRLGAISYFIKYKILFPLVLRKAIYKSNKIIAPSNYTKQSILKHFSKTEPRTDLPLGEFSTGVDAEKIEVIYESVPMLEPEAPRALRAQSATTYNLQPTTYLLYVGNALPHKNLEFLVRVFKKLKEQLEIGPEAPKVLRAQHTLKLVLVGAPSYFYERLKKYVRDFRLENEIVFTGALSDEELAELYKNAAAYIFPSLLEGFGLPPLEAMSYGTPVAAARSSCLPEILGDAAIYFDPKNEDEALETISELLNNENLRQKLREKGYAQIQKYSWQEQAAKTMDTYKSVIHW